MGGIYHQMGQVYLQKINIEQAAFYYQKAVDNFKEHSHPFLPLALESQQIIEMV